MTTTTAAPATRYKDVYQTKNVYGARTLYMNCGLWDDGCTDGDDAARAMIARVAALAGIGPQTTLLDVGFGFGDQLLDWCATQGLGDADGVNVCPEQTAVAAARIEAAGLAGRVRVQVGDAVSLPFAAARFTAVTAVECAFHFSSRAHFFAEAQRVLLPGGRLVLADYIGRDDPTLLERLTQRVSGAWWGIPPAMFWSQAQYGAALARAGFVDVELEVVTDRVIAPSVRNVRRRLSDPELRRRMDPKLWWSSKIGLGLSGWLGDPPPGEFVFAHATKR